MYKLNINNEDLKNINIEDINEYIKHIEKLTNIIWKIIPDYEDYIISEYGDIISIRSKKILKPFLDKDKYYRIVLYKNTIKKTFFAHRLVYFVFINNKDIKGFDIHHKDENKLNNHYSNLQKMTKSNHKKYHHNLESEEHLNRYKEYYNLKYKDHLSTEEIAKRYNVSERSISSGIQNYKIYLSNNENINKYNNLNIKKKKDFYSNIILKEDKRKYLKECEEIYKKYKIGLSIKKLAKIYNTTKSAIEYKINYYEIYLFNNKNFDTFSKIPRKEKEKLKKDIVNIKRKKYLKEYLRKCEVIYNKKNKENLSNKKLAKIYNLSINKIDHRIKDIKIYIFILDRDFDKFKTLSKKEKLKLRKKITAIEKKEEFKKYLEKAEEIYNRKNKDNLTYEELSKIYNISETGIIDRIQNIKSFIFILDRNFDKFYNLSKKEKEKIKKDIVNIERKEYIKEYLEKAEEIYNRKNKDNLTYEELSKIYNIPKNSIESRYQDIEIFIKVLNKDFNKFYNLSKKQKEKLRKNITEIERKEYIKEYLKKAEEIYNKKNKDNLTYKELAKLYNMPKTNIIDRCQDIKSFIFILDRDFDKFYKLTEKQRRELRKDIVNIKRKKYLKEYLRKCEVIYNKKNKENLSNKELAKIYNLPEYTIRIMIRNIKVFIKILNRDFDKFYNLSKKEKEKLRKNITEIERKKYVKDYLKKCEVIYNKKNKKNLSNKELAKIYNLSMNKIDHCIQDIKFYIFLLDRNFDKFYNLTKKQKLKLRKKITAINKWNDNVLYIGKQIEDLKLSGVSNKDIANKLNLSINRISDIYKKYKKLINDRKIKDELKSIKNITNKNLKI